MISSSSSNPMKLTIDCEGKEEEGVLHNLDCSNLLKHVRGRNHSDDDEGDDDDDERAKIEVMSLPTYHSQTVEPSSVGISILLVVAYNRHCAFAQLFTSDGNSESESGEVRVVSVWPVESDEGVISGVEIQTVGLVGLELAWDDDACLHVSVVLGTTDCRVISVPFQIAAATTTAQPGTLDLTRFSDMAPFLEPLPIDHTDNNNNNNNSNKNKNSRSVYDEEDTSSFSRRHASSERLSVNDGISSETSSAIHYPPSNNTNNTHTTSAKSTSKLEAALESAVAKVDDSSKNKTPFQPSGGVSLILLHYSQNKSQQHPNTPNQQPPSFDNDQIDHNNETNTDNNYQNRKQNNPPPLLWIAYGDGTIVTLPHSACFPFAANDTLPTRSRIVLPPSSSDSNIILPLPMVHLSLLADPSLSSHTFLHALVMNKQLSTCAYYTNEDQLLSHQFHHEVGSKLDVLSYVKDTMMGGAKTIARGVLGGMVSAVQWASTSNTTKEDQKHSFDENQQNSTNAGPDDVLDEQNTSVQHKQKSVFQGDKQKFLPLGLLTQLDVPRTFTHASVSPDGNYVALADSLGRIQLIDLQHQKFIIRMWKGLRDATSHWIVYKNIRYLAIHTRQRNVIEIYRLRHGPRVATITTQSNSQILQCQTPHHPNYDTMCFLSQHDNNNMVTIKPILIHDTSLHNQNSPTNNANVSIGEPQPSSNSNTKKMTTMQLQLLRQMLAADNHHQYDFDAIYVAMTQITTIVELSKAMDLLAISSFSHDDNSSQFHAEVVAHCQEQLHVISQEEMDSRNPLLEKFSQKIERHSQIIEAYDVLNKFETASYSDDEDDENNTTTSSPRIAWALEAISWLETHIEILQSKDDDYAQPKSKKDVLKFSTFCKACLQESSIDTTNRIYLCDSTKERTYILSHIFQPLLHDIFLFKTVTAIFTCLQLQSDHETLQKYFGEWFLSLPAKTSAKASLFGTYCPILRWLQELLKSMMEEQLEKNSEDQEKVEFLYFESIFKLCSESSNLPRALLLAVICTEAISVTSKQYEAKTYGKISSSIAVKSWVELIRKLRVCLLFSLRLHGESLGPVPITVSNIEDGTIFSIYQWLARDELFFSHKNEEIVAFEELFSNYDKRWFDPSTKDGDLLIRWKLLQQTCIDRQKKMNLSFFQDEKSDTGAAPLLFHFQQFYNPIQLAAHRALILTEMWGRNPESLELLKSVIATLRYLHSNATIKEITTIVISTCLEIWQTHIRPIYRALFFGFHDVHELSEEVMDTLLMNDVWRHQLNHLSFGLISIIADVIAVNKSKDNNATASSMENTDTRFLSNWPKSGNDVILNHIRRRAGMHLYESSLNFHKAIIMATHVNDDFTDLPYCFPNFEESFLDTSLFDDVLEEPSDDSGNEDKNKYIMDATRKKAELIEGSSVQESDLKELILLGEYWQMERSQIITQFILCAYEVGKDSMVDNLLNTLILQHGLDMSRFLKGSIEISCIRLNATIFAVKKMKQYRGILGMLEADTCQWVKELADSAIKDRPAMKAFMKDNGTPSLDGTHMLVLKILRMDTGTNRSEAHALSVLSGTLLRAMQEIQCKKLSDGYNL